jgi:hypothetical protein
MDTTHTRRRWFGIFSLFKDIAVGIALGTLVTPVGNSSFLFGIYAFSFLIQTITRPQIDLYACASEVYTAGVQVCST